MHEFYHSHSFLASDAELGGKGLQGAGLRWGGAAMGCRSPRGWGAGATGVPASPSPRRQRGGTRLGAGPDWWQWGARGVQAAAGRALLSPSAARVLGGSSFSALQKLILHSSYNLFPFSHFNKNESIRKHCCTQERARSDIIKKWLQSGCFPNGLSYQPTPPCTPLCSQPPEASFTFLNNPSLIFMTWGG